MKLKAADSCNKMKWFTIVLVAASVLAEPPVNNRYLPPSQSYGVPGFGGQRQTDAIIRSRPSSAYNAPRRPSVEYGPPQTPSNQYGPPSQALSNELGPPSQISNQYLPPSSRTSQPSAQYGAPSQGFSTDITYATPSQEYGAPGFGSRGGNRFSQNGFGSISGNNRAANIQYRPLNQNQNGYSYNDDSNSEPANYNFEYMVKDEPSGNDFGHRESRQGDRAEGLYYVLLPDGRKQTVEYEADENGYRPKISYQDVGVGAGGYNRNAQSGYSAGGYQY